MLQRSIGQKVHWVLKQTVNIVYVVSIVIFFSQYVRFSYKGVCTDKLKISIGKWTIVHTTVDIYGLTWILVSIETNGENSMLTTAW